MVLQCAGNIAESLHRCTRRPDIVFLRRHLHDCHGSHGFECFRPIPPAAAVAATAVQRAPLHDVTAALTSAAAAAVGRAHTHNGEWGRAAGDESSAAGTAAADAGDESGFQSPGVGVPEPEASGAR